MTSISRLPEIRGIRTALLAGACLCGAAMPALAANTYLAVWSSDKETDDNHLDPDFLAIIDADPTSSTYGKVVNTATLQNVPNANLLDELGLASGIPSNVLNEAHHMNHDPLVVNGHSYLFMGGLISANIFRCDVTNPLSISTCPLLIQSTQVSNFSAPDDFIPAPDGNLLVTYMGAKNLTTPGGVVEISPSGQVVGQYAAAIPNGPTRYIPSVNGVTNTGLLAHPHGISARPDLNLLVTSDFADPLSVAEMTSFDATTQDNGTTVRFWQLNNLAAGPTAIAQVPLGNGLEQNPETNSPEGVMSVGLTNLAGHKGAFAASMMGGALFYTPDATLPNPVFHEVYDFGPGAGASLFVITPDDRYIVVPVAGLQSPGDPLFNRDYFGEHDRRLTVLNIQPLLAAGTNIQCAAPQSIIGRNGYVQQVLGHNNNAPDCPVFTSVLPLDSITNFTTHGGPHFVAVDHQSRRMAVAEYFVQLTPFGLPGSGSAGDDRVCMTYLTQGGQIVIDPTFRDELTGLPCVSMDRPTTYAWPNRGKTGAAKPHAMAFINLGTSEQ